MRLGLGSGRAGRARCRRRRGRARDRASAAAPAAPAAAVPPARAASARRRRAAPALRRRRTGAAAGRGAASVGRVAPRRRATLLATSIHSAISSSLSRRSRAGAVFPPSPSRLVSSVGSRTANRPRWRIAPARAPAASPPPKKMSARAGPTIADPVSWAIISRRNRLDASLSQGSAASIQNGRP